MLAVHATGVELQLNGVLLRYESVPDALLDLGALMATDEAKLLGLVESLEARLAVVEKTVESTRAAYESAHAQIVSVKTRAA